MKPPDDNDVVRERGHAALDPLAGDVIPVAAGGAAVVPDGNDGGARKKRSERPEIVICTDEGHVIDEAIAALASNRHIFRRGGALVHVVRDESKLSGVIRPAGAPRIVPLPLPRLRELMSDAASWQKIDDGLLVLAHPPEWAVRGLDARGAWPSLRSLEAVVETPVLRPDGTVLDEAGYDGATGLLLVPGSDFPPCPAQPTFEDARRALALLLEVVADFPFSSPAHRSSWLSAVLSPLARFAFRGPAPLHLIDANVRGAGKSLLADTIAEIVDGRPMARMAPSEDDAEERKRITALAIAGDRLVLIDNVSGVFGTASLDAALTSVDWQDRLLGTNITLRWPLLVTWYATGNNIILNGDTSRRCLHIRLESPEERPEERDGFRHADLLGWIRDNRPALLCAALTMLRAYCAAERPAQKIAAWESFDGWSGLVRSAIVWAGEDDPGLTREELRKDSDRDASALASLIAGWEAIAAGYSGQCTVSQVLSELDGPTNAGKHQLLREALGELAPTPPGKLPSAHRVGKVLARFKGRVVGGRALVKATGHTKNGIAWRVQSVAPVACGNEHAAAPAPSPGESHADA